MQKDYIGFRLDPDLLQKIDHIAEQRGCPRSKVLTEAIQEYLSGIPDHAFKTKDFSLKNYVPDYKEQQKSFSRLEQKLEQYIQTNDELHKYIASQKSAESFYFREINEKISVLQERNDYLEEITKRLLENPAQSEPKAKKTSSDILAQLMGN